MSEELQGASTEEDHTG